MNQISLQPVQIYVPLFVVCAIVLVLGSESVVSMAALWQLSSYQHAWLIPLISLYLLWTYRGSVGQCVPRPSLSGWLAFLLVAWAWLVARMTFVQAVEHLALWGLLNAGVWAVLGWPVYRRLMIPMVFLFLALPIGTSIVPLLQEVTAGLAKGLLLLLGVPAYQEGMHFSLPGGRFVVAEICGGYRYFNAGLTISALFAVFMFRSLVKAALFIGGSVLFFVLINGVRAGIVMAVASATDMRLLADDHILFGWVLFAVGMLVIYAIGLRFADKPAEQATT